MTVPSCSLDAGGMALQRERLARVGGDAAAIERSPDELRVTFRPGFARDALDEVLAVERQCCPFFRFDFDERALELRVRVAEPGQEPALDALAYGLGARLTGPPPPPRDAPA